MNTLLEQLNDLKQQGADSYNPTRFCFIQSLIRRAAKQRHNVREQLESKAQAALDTYQKAMVQKTMALAQKNTALVDGTAATPLPAKIPTTLIPTTPSALASLTQYLLKPADEQMPNNALSIASFSEQLQQQTHSLLEKSHCLLSVSDKKTDVPIDTRSALKSSIAYQQHQEKKRVDDFIDIALKQTPENPGPLNPEILAIGLLKSVRDLSPEYLSRYVSYFETLQRLNHEGG